MKKYLQTSKAVLLILVAGLCFALSSCPAPVGPPDTETPGTDTPDTETPDTETPVIVVPESW